MLSALQMFNPKRYVLLVGTVLAVLYFTSINLYERPDQEIIDIASVTDWNLKDNDDLFFGVEKNRANPHIQDDEIIERTEAELVETAVSLTTTTTTTSTTTSSQASTTTTEIKTTTSATTSTVSDEYDAKADNDVTDNQKLEDDLKPFIDNDILEIDEVEVKSSNLVKDKNVEGFKEDLISDPTLLLVGKDKSECSNLVLIFHQLKFQFEENYKNFDKLISTNVPAIIFCSYSAYFNFKKSKKLQRFVHTPTLLFPYFTEPAQFEIQSTTLEVKNAVKNGTYQFKIAESKFNRVAKVSQEYIEIDLERIFYLSFSNEDAAKTSNATILSSIYFNDTEKPISLTYENCFIFSMQPDFILNQIHLIDILHEVTGGIFSTDLERYIQIDIDDMFVGSEGTRIIKSDVDAMIEFQEKWDPVVPGIHFVIGFSGKFFQRSNNQMENEGDQYILEKASSFRWFPHMWSHMESSRFESSEILCKYMKDNFVFHLRYNIPLEENYAVAPHHTGAYPVYQPLVDCWRNVWNVTITSSEEYPHLRPAYARQGFIYDGLRVLPRSLCELFTHTIYYDQFPKGGPERFDKLVNGGQVFQLILKQKFNIFMTHQQNYAGDRLSLRMFDGLFERFQRWTNLKLSQIDSKTYADMYFKDFPSEVDPVWSNPCDDKRHLEMIPKYEEKCRMIPSFVIIGPQKTGTTALMNFLSAHPDIEKSEPSDLHFEELQFFSNDEEYFKGIDHYFDSFSNSTKTKFEKSATYFTDLKSPKRLKTFLPRAKVIVLLLDPTERAYSWYQHQMAHDDPAAVSYSFYEILTSQPSDGDRWRLKMHCLQPGHYSENLKRWFKYFGDTSVITLDGNLLKSDPIKVMNNLQIELGLQLYVDYSNLLEYKETKGYFCLKGKTEGTLGVCLGRGKGRDYPEMDKVSKQFLSDYYNKFNQDLKTLLLSTGKTLPSWLKKK